MIFYSNQITQTSNCFISSMSKRRGEVQGFVFYFPIEGLQLLLMRTSLDPTSKSFDRASKGFWKSTTKLDRWAKSKARGHNGLKQEKQSSKHITIKCSLVTIA
jgi:hypothetical protein